MATRQEKINKLKSLKLCITGLTATYDMGLEFSILTNEGAGQCLGEVGSWPINCISIDDNLKSLQDSILKNEDYPHSELLCHEWVKNLFTYSSTPWSEEFLVEDDELLGQFIQEFKGLKLKDACFYAFARLENWHREIKLFDTYSELEDYLIFIWKENTSDYESMDDDSLDYYFGLAEDEEWANIVPMYRKSE